MQNIIDYVQNEYLTFDEKPLCRVDSLVFSALSYLKFEVIFKNYIDNNEVKKPALYVDSDYSFFSVRDSDGKIVQLHFYDFLEAEYFEKAGTSSPSQEEKLLRAVTKSPRFRSVRLCFYVNKFDSELEMQFAAITYLLSDNLAFVAFRGTDSSLIGWKEDFNMAYTCPVPAQAAASIYLNAAAPYLPNTIFVGGHSKGGNLAVYSAFKAKEDVIRKIKYVFSHDGPGFRKEIVESEEFLKISSKVRKTVPQDSIVGMLLQNHENYEVIKSSAKFIDQHDPFTWEVKNGDFVPVESVSQASLYADRSLSEWIENMTDEKRRIFIDELFRVFSATKAATFDDIKKNWSFALPAMLLAITNTDAETKAIMAELLSSLAKAFHSNIFD